MNLITLLDLSLKSDEVIETLDQYDVSVIYDFDRLRENIPDAYWASSHEGGFELRFNERQVLGTIFMHVLPRDGFKPINPGISGVPFPRSFAEARATFQGAGIPFSTSANGEGWIKGNLEKHAIHYEFNGEGKLSLVTVITADA